MDDFMIRFLICNLLVSVPVGILLAARRMLKNILSCRMQYHLWFFMLCLLAVPFLPHRLSGFYTLDSLRGVCRRLSLSGIENVVEPGGNFVLTGDMGWMNDFTLSVSSRTPSGTGSILLGIWLAGILLMILLVLRSAVRLQKIKQSALPLQHPDIRRLYSQCLEELRIKRRIPLYSTAFLKSPVITGFLNPRIYLPIHIISDHMKTGSKAAGRTTCYAENPEISGGSEPDGLRPIRYMLLHELQHYRHKDAFAGCLMTLAGILYWFNPVVWIALGEMRNDREIACDTSVLNMLETDLHEDYGRTLIDFAGKLSRPAFLFTAGLGGNMAQMKRRILNIAAYEKPTIKRQLAGITAFLMITALLLGMAPVLSANGSESDHYRWDDSHKNITDLDLASYFQGYEGSFVLYDMRQEMWSVYDIERAAFRVSPDSTYKIYDALFGLEEGVITPEDSYMEWDREACPIKEWNMDQTLRSAMQHSVNWYFMEIDECLGASAVDRYIRQIGYGNEDTDSKDVPCWLESSLKISPIEQVELLRRFYENSLGFSDRNVDAVKDAIRISSSASGTLYGKTGTGRIEGMDVNGWFVGYVETLNNTWFFAINISAEDEAAGSNAVKIAEHILDDLGIWKFAEFLPGE